MEHSEATRIQASSRYLMGGLSAAEAEAFEEHYFSCPECAEEVTSGFHFAENLRAELGRQTAPARAGIIRWRFYSIPLAAAACLLLTASLYEYLTIHRLRTEISALSAPQGPPWVPLKVARGGGALTLPKGGAFFLAYFQPPAESSSSAYRCAFENAQGVMPRPAVTLPAPPPGQPLAILLRRSDFPSGMYRFKVEGQDPPGPSTTYTVELNTN